MQRALIFTVLLALIVSLSGCSKGDSADDIEAREICHFKKLYKDVNVGIGCKDDIFVDVTTGVLYFRAYGTSGFTPLYNADGTPKTWDKYEGAENVQQEVKSKN